MVLTYGFIGLLISISYVLSKNPVIRSSPKRTQMVLIFGFIGFVFSVLYVAVKKPLEDIMAVINS